MVRVFAFSCLFCAAATVMAQSNASSIPQHPADAAESAWVEMMPALTPPPVRVSVPPVPPQEPVHAVRISGGVMAGLVLTKVDPVYPADARSKHMEGAVVLSAKIGPDGTVQDLQAVTGPEVLRTAALDAVRQWTYKPYVLKGAPVTVLTTVTVNFHLNDAPAQ